MININTLENKKNFDKRSLLSVYLILQKETQKWFEQSNVVYIDFVPILEILGLV